MRAIKLLAVHGKRPIALALIFLVLCPALFAKGKKEEDKRETVNNDFILCITSFDVSDLPPGMQILGSVLQRELVLDLSRIHYRIRSDDEISRYQELAMTAAMSAAAAKLSSKRAERDALLFRGFPDWKYKKEIKKIDKELPELEEAYRKTMEEIPIVAGKPLFLMSEQNIKGGFPLPPGKGGEEVFLKTYKYDAFLEGKFRLVYGRVYAEFRFFTRGASFIYEDSTIFSQEDLNAAADELKSRFLTALVNSKPAALLVTAEPEDARLELNGRLVKSGETVELPPGPVIIRASADDHQSIEREIELEGGNSEEIAFILKPFTMEIMGIDLGGKTGSVYLGAMYLGGNVAADKIAEVKTTDGEIPVEEIVSEEIAEAADEEELRPWFFSVYVPVGQYRYIRVETEDGLTGEAIVKGSSTGEERIITLQPRPLPGKDDKPVEDKRKKFYGAYGRFWIVLPLAFLSGWLYSDNKNGYAVSGSRDMLVKRNVWCGVFIGGVSVAGGFLVESLVRMGIYIHTASKEAIPYIE